MEKRLLPVPAENPVNEPKEGREPKEKAAGAIDDAVLLSVEEKENVPAVVAAVVEVEAEEEEEDEEEEEEKEPKENPPPPVPNENPADVLVAKEFTPFNPFPTLVVDARGAVLPKEKLGEGAEEEEAKEEEVVDAAVALPSFSPFSLGLGSSHAPHLSASLLLGVSHTVQFQNLAA